MVSLDNTSFSKTPLPGQDKNYATLFSLWPQQQPQGEGGLASVQQVIYVCMYARITSLIRTIQCHDPSVSITAIYHKQYHPRIDSRHGWI